MFKGQKCRGKHLSKWDRKNVRNQPWYQTWVGMLQRCTNPNFRDYSKWGGRGIKVCDRWLHSWNFFLDMGPRPPRASIERINNDGDYCPENCRWLPVGGYWEQNQNRRSTKLSIDKLKQIKQLYEQGVSQMFIANQLNVNQSTISRVLNGKRWQNVINEKGEIKCLPQV